MNKNNRIREEELYKFTALMMNLPFEDESFDIVLTECTTTLLVDKEKAFSEFIRVTTPGGYIGDLEMIWNE